MAEQQCHVLTLLGPAGIGKTRLVAELTRLIGPEAAVIRGRCLPYGAGITFWPLREMVASAAGFTDRDTTESVRASITALMGPASDAGLVTERICQALGLSAEPAPRDELFWAIRRLVTFLATERPLVVVFDDLHWAEPTLLDLIDHLAEHGRDTPLLVVCIARPEMAERPGTLGREQVNATTVTLEPFQSQAAGQLLSGLVGEGTLPVRLRDRLVETAEGNPLFLQELIAGLMDDGVIVPTGQRLGRHGEEARIAVPPTIVALMSARLDHLGPSERSVLGHASVMGRSFEREALLELGPVPDPVDLDAALRSLVRAGLLRVEDPRPDGAGTWRFRHLLTRDLTYAGLPKETRATLHEHFATWLERQRVGRLEEFEEITGVSPGAGLHPSAATGGVRRCSCVRSPIRRRAGSRRRADARSRAMTDPRPSRSSDAHRRYSRRRARSACPWSWSSPRCIEVGATLRVRVLPSNRRARRQWQQA